MQGPAIRIAGEMGLATVAADGDPRAPCAALADRFEQIDLKDKEGIETLARSLRSKENLAGIMTAGTDFSATAAWAAGRLGLPGIPYEAALDASDKERMRRRFALASLPSPGFVILTKTPEIEPALPFPYPVVVKPVDNMGARGCRAARGPEELGAAVKDALAFSRSARVIVEEYMEGPEFSVDALVYKGKMTICGLADRHIFFPPYFIEMGHTMPTACTGPGIAGLLQVFEAGARALGITNGAAKGDMKLTAKGPMIGEIAARLSGGYMSGWTYPCASGVILTKGAIQIAIGEAPSSLAPTRRWTSAERAFISIPGAVRTIRGLAAAESAAYVKQVFSRAAKGSAVSFPENNVAKCGNVISAAPTREQAVQAAEQAARSILIRLEAPNTDTRAFLDGPAAPGAFPPPAFPIPPELEALLAAMPDSEGAAGIIPFPAFMDSGLTDYMGRSPGETLDAVRELTGLPLPLGEGSGVLPSALGRGFWAALIRGGYQGAVYYLDDRFLG
jgi:biotin carboxylase